LNKGRSAFYEYGPFENDKIEWKDAEAEETLRLGERWKYGCTGMPLIDAFMRELNATGYISNRGRQIVCSYLTQDLKIDWRWGAAWFEERLLDHDVH
jgi:deoxyribodipyrimidine photo-lyase